MQRGTGGWAEQRTVAAGVVGQSQLGDSDAKAEANQVSAAARLEAHITHHTVVGRKGSGGEEVCCRPVIAPK